MEIWKDIENSRSHQISNLKRVRSVVDGKVTILKQQKAKHGYIVNIVMHGKKTLRTVSKLHEQTFCNHEVTGEVWKHVLGFENEYMISDKKNVKSLSRITKNGVAVYSKLLKLLHEYKGGVCVYLGRERYKVDYLYDITFNNADIIAKRRYTHQEIKPKPKPRKEVKAKIIIKVKPEVHKVNVKPNDFISIRVKSLVDKFRAMKDLNPQRYYK